MPTDLLWVAFGFQMPHLQNTQRAGGGGGSPHGAQMRHACALRVTENVLLVAAAHIPSTNVYWLVSGVRWCPRRSSKL